MYHVRIRFIDSVHFLCSCWTDSLSMALLKIEEVMNDVNNPAFFNQPTPDVIVFLTREPK